MYFLLKLNDLSRFQFFVFGLFLAISPLVYTILGVLLISFLILMLAYKDVRGLIKKNKAFILGVIIGLFFYLLYHQVVYDTPIPPQIVHLSLKSSYHISDGIFEVILIKLERLITVGYKSVYAFSAVLLPLIICGIYRLWKDFATIPKEKRMAIIGFGIVAFLYLLYFIFASFAFRHFVPLAPFFLSFAALYLSKLERKELTVFVILVLIPVSLTPIAQYPHTFYYPDWEKEYVSDHLSAKECALFLKEQERGIVLAYGGNRVDLFYYARYPFINAYKYPYGLLNSAELSEILTKYKPMYIWTEKKYLDIFLDDFEVIKSKNDFYLLKRKMGMVP